MYVISTFEHSQYVELAITAIQMKGIPRENILAVPMDKRAEEGRLFDSIHYSDGLSMFDVPFVLGAFFSLMGAIYGFVLNWGPVIWGVIGQAFGHAVGLIIKLLALKRENRQKSKIAPEVVIIIECQENQMEMVKDTLWTHYALGVRKLDLGVGR